MVSKKKRLRTKRLRKHRNKTRRGGGKQYGGVKNTPISEGVKEYIHELKKVDLHVHIGGACTKEFFHGHLVRMAEICTVGENAPILQSFLKQTIEKLLNFDFKPVYKDLDHFRWDYDNYSDFLKILCGVDKNNSTFVYSPVTNKEPRSDGFNPKACLLQDGEPIYGCMNFLTHVFDHFKAEQMKHSCVALEISQTPFNSRKDEGKSGTDEYFEVVQAWNKSNTDFPVALISTCIRDLPNQFRTTINQDAIESVRYDVVKAIGVASSEKPPKFPKIKDTPQRFLCPDYTLPNEPRNMRVYLENMLQAFPPKKRLDGPVKLIPHVGEEYYGSDGKDVLASVDAYLQYNDPDTIPLLEEEHKHKLGFKLERLGHACQCGRSPELLDKLNKQKMTCELCLTSNDRILSTKVKDADIFRFPPFISMLNARVPVVLCSDDPAIFTRGMAGCILDNEYEYAFQLMIHYNGYTVLKALQELTKIANRSIYKSLALTDAQKQMHIQFNTDLLRPYFTGKVVDVELDELR